MNRLLKEIKMDESFCTNCTFFEKFDLQKKDDNILGSCKANPPMVPYLHPTDKNKLGVWPLVLGTFWCGVFQHIHIIVKKTEEKDEIGRL
jgi:hypothetical protein